MTQDEMTNVYAGKGTTALSIIGTILGGLGVLEGVSLPGLGKQDTISKEVFDLSMQLNKSERESDLVKAELNTEKKMVEVYNALNDKINAKVAEQQAINSAQAVTNTAVTTNMAVMNNNISQLMSLTQLYIPSERVTPKPMAEFNSWTAPT